MLSRAPSAVNRQPWSFSGDDTAPIIVVDEKTHIFGKYLSAWMDCGIATAHALLLADKRGVEVRGNCIIVQ